MTETSARREANRRKLTEQAVAQIKPPATGNVIVWDKLLPAFGVRVASTGRRTWIVALRRPGKKSPSKLRVGAAPAMTLAEAKERARQMMGTGAPEAPITFEDLVIEFLAHGRTKKGRDLRQNSLDQYRRAFKRHAAAWNKRPIAEISRRDVAALLATVARTSGGPMASLLRSMLTRLFGYAIGAGHREDNPASFTPGYEVRKRARTLSDQELRALWQATQEPSDYHLLLRLMIWTGTRRSEAGGMRWSELDTGVWTLPPERTKNGKKLVLPLSRQTVAALDSWPRLADRDLLFGRYGARGFARWSKAKAELDQRLRFNRAWVAHDLRRTTETELARLGVQKHVANLILNHAIDPVTMAYDQYDYATEKKQALQKWADHLETIVHA